MKLHKAKGNLPCAYILPILLLLFVHVQCTGVIVNHEYIVAFREYIPQAEHSNLLETLIGDSTSWELIPRENKASDLPSDFALINLQANENQIVAKLAKNKLVKYVTPQKKYTGHLHSADFITEDDIFFSSKIQQNHFNSTEEDNPFVYNIGRNSAKIPMSDEFGEFKHRKLHSSQQVTHVLNADFFWDKSFTGEGIKVAIFDTGLSGNHPHFTNVIERTDWTDEGTLEDYVGHGTFVAGVIASVEPFCSGFAPDAELYIFRVFTNSRVSYTSWFLDAFNYAIHCKVDILNLSIGGPDWMDKPFVEKVWELSANNIIVVSAIGNDGPLFGTLNNPADMLDVLGVGGVDFFDQLSVFSSRGMTTWELPEGYGRVKPDILAYGQSVTGSRLYDGCKTLSGTSVASPVVTGAITLLLSTLPESRRSQIVNPASIKQILVETSELIAGPSIFEQGFGRINLVAAYESLALYTPRASIIPSSLDLTMCPYMWPYCSQPMYYSAMPIIVNATILNGQGVVGEVYGEPTWEAGLNGEYLDVAFSYPEILWPWTGYFVIHIKVNELGKTFSGEAEGNIQVIIKSPGDIGERQDRQTVINLPLKVNIVPTPLSHKRILWDQFHSIVYPIGFFPRDMLWERSDPFDWNADHIHTNFREFYHTVRQLGFFIEVLGQPFTCFNADNYGTLIIADSEDEFSEEEKNKLYDDIKNGLSIVVIADWYNEQVIEAVKFFDENTNKWWTPLTGGSNVPALNDLLQPYGISFSSSIYSGEFSLSSFKAIYSSGTSISSFPAGGKLISHSFLDEATAFLSSKSIQKEIFFFGLFSTENERNPMGGRIVVFGDSSCFDDQLAGDSCLWLLPDILYYASLGEVSSLVAQHAVEIPQPFISKSIPPKRLPENQLHTVSRINQTTCSSVNYVRDTSYDPIQVLWQPQIYIQQEHVTKKHNEPELVVYLQENFRKYFVVYLVICCVVLGVIAYAIRRKSPSHPDVSKNYV